MRSYLIFVLVVNTLASPSRDVLNLGEWELYTNPFLYAAPVPQPTPAAPAFACPASRAEYSSAVAPVIEGAAACGDPEVKYPRNTALTTHVLVHNSIFYGSLPVQIPTVSSG